MKRKSIFASTPFLFVCTALLVFSACETKPDTTEQSKEEWISLFNGKDIDDWTVKIHHHDAGYNFGNTFRVEDSVIKVRYDQYGDFNDQFGHLYYKTPYSYYHLSLEYKFTGRWVETAPSYTILNSGVMFHSQDPYTMPKEQDWPISVEMQFLAGLGDGKPRPTGNMCSPGTDVVYQGRIDPRHCIESGSGTYEKEEWVKAELIVLGDSLVTHLINGDTVLQYSQPQIGGGVANRYDPAIKIDGKLLQSGFIALQSEGQEIDFRNIKLLNLEGCMDPGSKYYKTYFVKNDPEQCR
ncbi:MAG: DUF1080 domain-containing protein [Chitinophagaceae bacterium]|nr:DUF1080 domain-containing protein [Chitinophagaceae bacterium]MCW5926490.1 DUF1080 domain-containing protein [Chitinophagaceae bacterium]